MPAMIRQTISGTPEVSSMPGIDRPRQIAQPTTHRLTPAKLVREDAAQDIESHAGKHHDRDQFF